MNKIIYSLVRFLSTFTRSHLLLLSPPPTSIAEGVLERRQDTVVVADCVDSPCPCSTSTRLVRQSVVESKAAAKHEPSSYDPCTRFLTPSIISQVVKYLLTTWNEIHQVHKFLEEKAKILVTQDRRSFRALRLVHKSSLVRAWLPSFSLGPCTPE